jgi:hypothetical protein
MTIEECILDLEEDAKGHYEMVAAYHSDEGVYLMEETYHREKAERSEQIAEWLKELKEYRQRGLCKDCKHFEYDSVAMVDGIPLIVAHEICNKWGDGCKTKEDGYCFMFEGKEK